MGLLSNPIFLTVVGAAVSFVGSIWANRMFYGKVEKSRAEREAKRAYAKLMNVLMHTEATDLNHPLHLLPVEIADRVEDLKFAIADVNPQFDHMKQVQAAIDQAAELRKQQQEKYGTRPPDSH